MAEQIKKFGVEHLDRAVMEYERELQPRAEGLFDLAAQLTALLYASDASNAWAEFAARQGIAA